MTHAQDTSSNREAPSGAAPQPGRQRVIASGNALRRNPLLQTAAAEVLGVPVILFPSVEEAACGAAMNARALLD